MKFFLLFMLCSCSFSFKDNIFLRCSKKKNTNVVDIFIKHVYSFDSLLFLVRSFIHQSPINGMKSRIISFLSLSMQS